MYIEMSDLLYTVVYLCLTVAGTLVGIRIAYWLETIGW